MTTAVVVALICSATVGIVAGWCLARINQDCDYNPYEERDERK